MKKWRTAKLFQSFFAHFLFSYLLVLLIPTAVLYGLYSHYLTRMVADEILSSAELDQQHAVALIDNELADLDNIACQLQLTQGYQTYIATSNFFPAGAGSMYGEFIEDIFAFQKMDLFSKNFFVYFFDESCVFSTNGLHQIDTFVRTGYRFERYPPERFKELMRGVCQPQVLERQQVSIAGERDDYVTFLYPLRSDFVHTVAVAVFCVRNDTIQRMFSGRMRDYAAATFLFDRDGRLIAGDEPAPDVLEALGALPAGAPARQRVRIAGKPYFLLRAVSPQNGWEYLTLLPEEQSIFIRIAHMSKDFLFFTSIALLAAFGAALLMMRVNYRPIRALKDKARAFTEPHPQATELETISHALDYLHERSDTLYAQHINNLSLIKNGKLRGLLGGAYANVEEFNIDCEQLGLGFSHDSFFVSTIELQSETGLVEQVEQVAQAIQQSLERHFESKYIYGLSQGRITVIHCVKTGAPARIVPAYEEVLQMLERQYAVKATAGIGGICRGAGQIGKSHLESQSALDYRFVKGVGAVILFSDIAAGQESAPAYPYGEFERLRNAVLTGNARGISERIAALLAYLNENNVPLFLARGICFDIMKTISENILRSRRSLPSLQLDFSSLSAIETAQDLTKVIEQLLAQLGAAGGHIAYNDSLLSEILRYIDQNYPRCDFSIQEVSDKFSILPSNLSAFFKNKTGRGILEHVIDLRMEKAKELLRTTPLPLKDIGYAVGYYNVSSFIRRFKDHQGVTPGAYRASWEDARGTGA